MICEHCGKAKEEHFQKYDESYDRGLRNRFFCKRYGIVQFKDSSNLNNTKVEE